MTMIKGLASLWTSKNPTGKFGDIGVEKDSLRFKIFDGATAWVSLAYAALTATSTDVVTNKDLTSTTNTFPATLERIANKGAANGYAPLGAGGTIAPQYLGAAVMEYQGTWNASTNAPTLADGTGSAGDVYRVTTGASRNLGSGAITFDVGDNVVYNGTVWEKWDHTDAVASVAGRTGAVVITTADLTNFATAVDAEIAAGTHAATSKTTPVDADELPLVDSAASNGLKRLTWANLKATVAAYYDSLTSTMTNKTITLPKVDRLVTTSGSWLLSLTHGGSINLLNVTNAATGVAPSFGVDSISGDTNVDLNLVTKGAGVVKANGVAVVTSPSTSSVIGTGSIELGHASDTTISRYAAGVIAVEGAIISTKSVVTLTSTATLPAVAGREFVYLLGTGAVPTLPTAVGSASYYVLKNTTVGTITVSTTSSQTIEGSTTRVLAAGEAITVVSDQANWKIV